MADLCPTCRPDALQSTATLFGSFGVHPRADNYRRIDVAAIRIRARHTRVTRPEPILETILAEIAARLQAVLASSCVSRSWTRDQRSAAPIRSKKAMPTNSGP